MSEHSFETELPSGLPVTIEFDYVRGCPGRMYMSNGDPGYPPEPDDYEVNAVLHIVGEGEDAVVYNLTMELDQSLFDDGGAIMEACEAHIEKLNEAFAEAEAEYYASLPDIGIDEEIF